MKSRHVTVILSWIQIADSGSLSEVSLYDLFVAAFLPYEEVDTTSRSRIEQDLQDFDRHGYVPTYVARFLREELYPLFVAHGVPQPEGGRECKSELLS